MFCLWSVTLLSFIFGRFKREEADFGATSRGNLSTMHWLNEAKTVYFLFLYGERTGLIIYLLVSCYTFTYFLNGTIFVRWLNLMYQIMKCAKWSMFTQQKNNISWKCTFCVFFSFWKRWSMILFVKTFDLSCSRVIVWLYSRLTRNSSGKGIGKANDSWYIELIVLGLTRGAKVKVENETGRMRKNAWMTCCPKCCCFFYPRVHTCLVILGWGTATLTLFAFCVMDLWSF